MRRILGLSKRLELIVRDEPLRIDDLLDIEETAQAIERLAMTEREERR